MNKTLKMDEQSEQMKKRIDQNQKLRLEIKKDYCGCASKIQISEATLKK